VIVFPSSPDAEEHANAEIKRKRALFQWADGVLEALGLADLVARANGPDDLRKVCFDVEPVEVTLAIREALRPASDEKVDDCFAGLRPGSLKKILKKRFAEMKAQRERELPAVERHRQI
jgi:hypothetical protein